VRLPVGAGGSEGMRWCLHQHADRPEQLRRLRSRLRGRPGLRRHGHLRERVHRWLHALRRRRRPLLRRPHDRPGELRRVRQKMRQRAPRGWLLLQRLLPPRVRRRMGRWQRQLGRRLRVSARRAGGLRWCRQQLQRHGRRGLRVLGRRGGGLHRRRLVYGRPSMPGRLHVVGVHQRGLGVLLTRLVEVVRELRHAVLYRDVLLGALRVRGRVRAGRDRRAELRRLQRRGEDLRRRLRLGWLG